MGAQQLARREIEGVMHVASRMVLRHIQGAEVVEFILYFGSRPRREPRARQDVPDPSDRSRQWVLGPWRNPAARQAYVHPPRAQLLAQPPLAQGLLACRNRRA